MRGSSPRNGRRAGTPRIVVHRGPMDEAHGDRPARVGFVVSSAVGHAVTRHRVTRQLRALMSARIDRLPSGTDLVVRATPEAANAGSAALSADLDRCLPRVCS
ncbi:ribonuclease P protein component [Ornithinimicrobium sp.]|uniref:ribonuclease P protein component n=1 Tax=Ornithinimicrobium sp. TaxID=1977084 RepID=UPI0039C9B649